MHSHPGAGDEKQESGKENSPGFAPVEPELDRACEASPAREAFQGMAIGRRQIPSYIA